MFRPTVSFSLVFLWLDCFMCVLFCLFALQSLMSLRIIQQPGIIISQTLFVFCRFNKTARNYNNVEQSLQGSSETEQPKYSPPSQEKKSDNTTYILSICKASPNVISWYRCFRKSCCKNRATRLFNGRIREVPIMKCAKSQYHRATVVAWLTKDRARALAGQAYSKICWCLSSQQSTYEDTSQYMLRIWWGTLSSFSSNRVTCTRIPGAENRWVTASSAVTVSFLYFFNRLLPTTVRLHCQKSCRIVTRFPLGCLQPASENINIFTPAVSNPRRAPLMRHNWWFFVAQMKISLLCVFNTNMPYFDNLKFDVFDVVFLSATLSRQDCLQADLLVSTEVQTNF